MTEREWIVEAMVTTYRERLQSELGPDGRMPFYFGDCDVKAMTAALDTILPLVLPEEPSNYVYDESMYANDRIANAFAARRKELSQ